MPPLVDLLEAVPSSQDGEIPGVYDPERQLRVDKSGLAIVEQMGAPLVGTETRGGRDHDDDLRSARGLDTITKQTADRDELRGLILTKTGGGRDTDDLRSPSAFAASPQT
jgi:hypothetical protein